MKSNLQQLPTPLRIIKTVNFTKRYTKQKFREIDFTKKLLLPKSFACCCTFRTKMNSTLEWIGFLQNDLTKKVSQSNNLHWGYAAFCSALVGLTGLVPILILPSFQNNANTNNNVTVTTENKKSQQQKNSSSHFMRWMLSFAVGGLLGDVFFHLLPEAFDNASTHEDMNFIGLCIIFGLLVFTILEKTLQNCGINQVSAYLNLIANCVDNFNHGLAVGGAFLISNKVGFMTTGCILIHEIPHELGDFAILMKDGLSLRQAALCQAATAFVGIIGALFALALDSSGMTGLVAFIVPFTCGGFLHIALVSVLPELLESEDFEDFSRVISGTISGILIMMAASMI